MKFIIFDLDGTLVDSQHMICASMEAAYAAHGMPTPERERLLSIVGLSLTEAFTALGGGAAGYPVATLAEHYRAAHVRLREAGAHDSALFPGAFDLVHALAAQTGTVLGIATGKSRRGVALFVERYGFQGCFSTVQTADDAPSKPHPGMVLQAMADIGAAPGQTVLVGDSIYDMAMARAAGATPFGVAWGYGPVAALREAGAAMVAADFTALSSMLGAAANAAGSKALSHA